MNTEDVLSGLQGQNLIDDEFGLIKEVTEQMKKDEALTNLGNL